MVLQNFIYNSGIRAYIGLIGLAAGFNPKAKAWIEGRKEQKNQIIQDFQDNKSLVAWFHCASLGEFEQARPLIEAFKTNFGQYKILLTFFSPSGYQIRHNYPLADWVYYLPADTTKQAQQFCDLVNPSLVFFIKYEFWYNFLTILAKKNIPVFSVSTILREGQWILNPNNPWGRASLTSFTHYFVQQNQTYALLNKEAKIPQSRLTLSGDTRYDRVWKIAHGGADNLTKVQVFAANKPVCVAGSVWDKDMRLIIDAYNSVYPKLKMIIAPHQINQNQIQEWKNNFKGNSILWSQIDAVSDAELLGADVLFVDTIGLLSSLYQYGTMAWIGGGFGAGIHNSLEAAAFGLPIGFGPKYKKFEEANQLIKLGAAQCCKDLTELQNWLSYQIQNPQESRQAGQKAANLVEQNRNATDIIIQKLKNFMVV